MASFQYRPLETPDTIRLALIPPSGSIAGHEQIKIRLGHADIMKVKGQYIALSYTWGDPTLSHTILVNEAECQITKNLEVFLRRPRNDQVSRTNSMYFWIDAICINQNDKKEKESQIPRMKLIYENSLFVHAELGPASEEQERAVREIPLISHAVLQEYRRVKDTKSEGSLLNHMRVPCLETYDSEFWNKISEMINLPWWKRAWVMQEASAIKNVEINYGNTTTKMFDLKGIHLAIILIKRRENYSARTALLPNEGPLKRVIDISNVRVANPTLLEVLKHFRGLQATKEHDILYAAANLAADIQPGDIQVDYDKTVSEVFSDVVAYYLRRLPVPLDVLEHSGQLDYEIVVKDSFTSWIPQWQNKLPPEPFIKVVVDSQNQTTTRIYNALGSVLPAKQLAKPSIRQSEIGPLLIVRGHKIDVIRSVQNPNLKFNAFEGASVINSWVPHHAAESYHPDTAITRLEAFLRTIVADFDVWAECRGNQAPWNFEKQVLRSEHKDFSNLHTRCHFRSLAETRKDYLALVDCRVRENDEIFLLYGGSVPYVLRPSDDKYYFLGECYVHGIMDGEAVKDNWSLETADEVIIC